MPGKMPSYEQLSATIKAARALAAAHERDDLVRFWDEQQAKLDAQRAAEKARLQTVAREWMP